MVSAVYEGRGGKGRRRQEQGSNDTTEQPSSPLLPAAIATGSHSTGRSRIGVLSCVKLGRKQNHTEDDPD